MLKVRVLGLFLLALVPACATEAGSADENPRGSQTHFLSECESSCGDGYACLCGVCTRTCENDTVCSEAAGSCERGPEGCSAERICDRSCESDTDCGSLGDSFACEENGRCRVPVGSETREPNGEAATDSGAAGQPLAEDASSPESPSLPEPNVSIDPVGPSGGGVGGGGPMVSMPSGGSQGQAAAAGAGGTAGASSSGTPAGATGLGGSSAGMGGSANVNGCPAGEVPCGPPGCSTCIPEFSGQNCPDTCGDAGAGGVAGTGGNAADAGAGGNAVNAGAGGASGTCDDTFCEQRCPETCPDGTACVEFFITAVTTDVWFECRPNPCGTEPTCACSDVASLCTPADSSQPLMCVGESSTPEAVIVCGFQGDCAAPDTPIATPTGERPLASLEIGDLVYSVDGDALVAVPIVQVNRKRVFEHRVVEVTLESGVVLHVSGEHPTADGGFFHELLERDALDGVPARSRWVPYPHSHTYDILPDSDTGTYVAGGVLVGSTLFGSSRPGADRE